LFFKRKTVAVAFGLLRFVGVATATPSGLKSFKVLAFLKKEGCGVVSRFGYLRLR